MSLDLTQLEALLPTRAPADPVGELERVAKAFAHSKAAIVAKSATAAGVERIPLDGLQVDHDYQRPPDWEKIAQMRAHLRSGGQLDPIKVNRRQDGSMWITNGQHRAAAHALEGHDTIHAIITEKPSQEEPQDTGIVTKVSAETEPAVLDRLRGAGARRVGKTLVLELGEHGQVRYTPHREQYAGASERGRLTVQSQRSRRVLELLDLQPQVAEIQGK